VYDENVNFFVKNQIDEHQDLIMMSQIDDVVYAHDQMMNLEMNNKCDFRSLKMIKY
jgi:hypothetical protein